MNHAMFSIVFAINFVGVYEVIPHKLRSGVRFETSGAKGTSGCSLAGPPSPAPLGREINWPLYYREPRHKSRVLIVSVPVGGRRRARGQNPLPSRKSGAARSRGWRKRGRKETCIYYLTRQRYPQIALCNY